MRLKDKFIPDYMFDNVLRIKPEFFSENGIEYVISDIDNTLATYDEELPCDDVKAWLDRVEASGVRIGLISNNSEKRVYKFNSVLGYLTVSRAGKPFCGKLKKLMKELGADKEHTCFIGDQIFTDVLCAKKAGIRAVMVRSLDVTGRPFLQFKKHFEEYFTEQYIERHLDEYGKGRRK